MRTLHGVPLNVKQGPQAAFNFDRVNGFSEHGGQPVNLVAAQSGVEWVQFENLPRLARRLLLRRAEAVEIVPKSFRRRVAIFYVHHGGFAWRAVSMSTVRPSSMSSIARNI